MRKRERGRKKRRARCQPQDNIQGLSGEELEGFWGKGVWGLGFYGVGSFGV